MSAAQPSGETCPVLGCHLHTLLSPPHLYFRHSLGLRDLSYWMPHLHTFHPYFCSQKFHSPNKKTFQHDNDMSVWQSRALHSFHGIHLWAGVTHVTSMKVSHMWQAWRRHTCDKHVNCRHNMQLFLMSIPGIRGFVANCAKPWPLTLSIGLICKM